MNQSGMDRTDADATPSDRTRLLALEQRLRQAMLDSDLETLDVLIDPQLLFVGPDGSVFGKQDDLALHRSGRQRLERIEFLESNLELHGDQVAVVTVLAELAGSVDGHRFAGRFRYLRTWKRQARDWRVIGGSVCASP